jgi:hypothetical protein
MHRERSGWERRQAACVRWVRLACVLGLGFPNGAAEPGKVFRAGAFAVDITPTNFPVLVNGGFFAATASQANDRLHARCLVLDDGETRVGLCVVDTCLIPRDLADRAKALVQQTVGLAPERILISATHTHSAPSLMAAHGADADPHYPAMLVPRIVEGIRRAVGNLAPAQVGWAVAPAPEHTHCRVWIRRPDKIELDPFGEHTVRANMHPGHRNPDAIAPSGPADPDLTLLAVRTSEGRPIALLANYAMHYYGATPVSADYFGRFAEKIGPLLGATNGEPPFVGIMSQGFSGDLHWMDYGAAAGGPGLDGYAEALAQIACAACQKIEYRDWAPLAMRDLDLPLSVRLPDEKRLAWARQLVAEMQGRAPKTLAEIYAREQLWLMDHPVRQVKLQALRVGDLGLAAVSAEVFSLSSLKLKAQTPLAATMNLGLANGEDGYIPPPEHHPLGSYNTWACRTACLEASAEPKVVDALLGLLEEVSGKPRRPLVDPRGPYALAVLKAEPLAYWRLNEFGGPQALDATRHGRPAAYEEGAAFYLEGPASPAFSGLAAVNRAVHFAGGRLTAPLPLPGEQYSVELWFWNGLPPRLRGVTGYLFAWGDRLAIGGTNGPAGRLVLSTAAGAETLTGPTPMPLKRWTHLVVARDRRRVSLYVNGALEAAGEAPPCDPAKARQLVLGGDEERTATLEGRLDEIAVYDRELGAAEVLRHFQDARLLATVPGLGRVPPDPAGPYCAAVLDLKPLAYWRLGENGFDGRSALDSSSHELHGLYEDGIELYHAGPAAPAFAGGQGTNHAPRFQGARLRACAKGLGSVYSVSFWFRNERPNDSQPVTAYLFSRGPGEAADAAGDHLGMGGTHLRQEGQLVFFNGNALNQVLAGRTVVPPRTWNHVLLVRDGRQVRVYLNGGGEPEIDGAIDVSPGAASEEVFLGGRNDNFANLNGSLDEAAIFGRALSPDELRRLWISLPASP